MGELNRFTDEQRDIMLAKLAASGMTVAAFCRKNNVGESTLRRWRRKTRLHTKNVEVDRIQYDDNFKKKVLKYLSTKYMNYAAASHKYGVSETSLRKWVAELGAVASTAQENEDSKRRAELTLKETAQLRKEGRDLVGKLMRRLDDKLENHELTTNQEIMLLRDVANYVMPKLDPKMQTTNGTDVIRGASIVYEKIISRYVEES